MIKGESCKLFLTDVDIVSKLAHWRLLRDLPTILNCDIADIVTLPSLVHRAKKACQKPDKIFCDTDTAEYAYEILSNMGIAPLPDADMVSILQRVPKIDSGEAILLAIASTENKSLLLTGDKKAIISFYAIFKEGKFDNIKGRICCLEQIINCFLDYFGLTELQKKVCGCPVKDNAIKNIFGSRCDANLASVQEGILSHIKDLEKEATGLLFKVS